jgi:hypothetical protein
MPGIHVFAALIRNEDVDGRDEPGHDDVGTRCTSLALIQRFAERRAERMAGVDADNAEFARDELQLLQRKRQVLVLWMAIDFALRGSYSQLVLVDPPSKLVMVQTALERGEDIWKLWAAAVKQFG